VEDIWDETERVRPISEENDVNLDADEDEDEDSDAPLHLKLTDPDHIR
jgi:hypothetical protein